MRKSDSDEHWYEIHLDGRIEPRFDATLRTARQHIANGGIGLFPSPTTVIGAMLAKPDLEAYKISSAIGGTLSALQRRAQGYSLTRHPGEDDSAFLQRALQGFIPAAADLQIRREAVSVARESVEVASSFGKRLHKAAEIYCRKGTVQVDEDIAPHFTHLRKWIDENVKKVHFTECMMFSRYGYAGTSDLGLELKNNRIAVADIKSGRWKEGTDKTRRPYSKFAHPLQLAAYRRCAEEMLHPDWRTADGVILHVCSNEPLPVVEQHFKRNDLDAYFDAFHGLLKSWMIQKEYLPVVLLLPENLEQKAREVHELSFVEDQARELTAALPVQPPGVEVLA